MLFPTYIHTSKYGVVVHRFFFVELQRRSVACRLLNVGLNAATCLAECHGWKPFTERYRTVHM